jgi:hypothetical protein
MTQIRRAESEIVSHSDPTCQTTLSLRMQRLINLRLASGGLLKRENRDNSLITEMRIRAAAACISKNLAIMGGVSFSIGERCG